MNPASPPLYTPADVQAPDSGGSLAASGTDTQPRPDFLLSGIIVELRVGTRNRLPRSRLCCREHIELHLAIARC
jgi:hypothetical protein